jgi:hypothetical protein
MVSDVAPAGPRFHATTSVSNIQKLKEEFGAEEKAE